MGLYTKPSLEANSSASFGPRLYKGREGKRETGERKGGGKGGGRGGRGERREEGGGMEEREKARED